MKVRERWRSGQSQTGAERRDDWHAQVRGEWGYGRRATERRNHFGLDGWIRRHLRACCWPRWDNWRGRLLKAAHSSKGAWQIAARPSWQTALSNAGWRRHGFWMPSDLAVTAGRAAAFNRRRRKTARPVGCEGAEMQPPAPDLIVDWFARYLQSHPQAGRCRRGPACFHRAGAGGRRMRSLILSKSL